MRAIKRADTKPEVALRSALHARGLRFRTDHRLDLEASRVRPDIVFTAKQVAVFVDGCFWHSCPEHGSRPTKNVDYWLPKLARTIERDAAATATLLAAGWTVVRVWEHVPLGRATEAVVSVVKERPQEGSPRHLVQVT